MTEMHLSGFTLLVKRLCFEKKHQASQIDPPREGLEKDLVSVLIDKKPEDLIYVSCAPDTLARDLKLLTADAYNVVDCQMIDMFPRTKHFESVTHLRLK